MEPGGPHPLDYARPAKRKRDVGLTIARCGMAHFIASYALGAATVVVMLIGGGDGGVFCLAVLAPIVWPLMLIVMMAEAPKMSGAGLSYIVAAVILYGVVFWLALRRMSRVALPPEERYPPGRCWNCGYDLRGSPVRCPECGNFPFRGLPIHTAAEVAAALSQLTSTEPVEVNPEPDESTELGAIRDELNRG